MTGIYAAFPVSVTAANYDKGVGDDLQTEQLGDTMKPLVEKTIFENQICWN